MAAAGAVAEDPTGDWQYFAWGGRLLVGQHTAFLAPLGHIDATAPGGLHVYGNYPILQIGSPALLLGRLFAFSPRDGAIVATAAIMLLGWLTVVAIDRAFTVPDRDRHAAVLIGGLLTVLPWAAVAHYGHLDDAIALAAVVGAGWAIRRHRWTTLGLLLGVAAATKPWAVAVLPLVLTAPTWAARARSCLLAAAVIVAAWLPFVIADDRTLHLGDQPLEFHRDSPLAAFGFHAVSHPGALRLSQFAVGLALAAFLVLRGAWPLVPLAAFAVRLAIDPVSYPYYGAAVVVGAFLADVALGRREVPVLTVLATGGWVLAETLPTHPAAVVRLVLYAVAAVGVCVAVLGRRGRPLHGAGE